LREGILSSAGPPVGMGGGGGGFGSFKFSKLTFSFFPKKGEKHWILFQITGIYGLLFAFWWEHHIPQANYV
jgi:hypothetical protein